MSFINREHEIDGFTSAWNHSEAELRLLYGRRRVGKTYLLQHFLQGRPHCYFLASAMTSARNIERLAQALINSSPSHSSLSSANVSTFWAIMQLYGEIAMEQRFALVLDEFQYLIEADASIPSQIQAWWDASGLRSNAYVVLCGSHVGTMNALAGANQPLYGRFTSRQKLHPMRYYDTARFYDSYGWSTRERLIAYGVLGGTPKYHATFSPDMDMASNIIKHLLSPDGMLHNEPEVVICSSSIREPALYNSMLQAVATGETRRSEIEQRAGVTPSQFGYCSQTLIDMEWMKREKPFGENSSKRTIYTITDHFIHFWYRFVSTLASELEFRDTTEVYKNRVEPYLNDYMGRYVFEDICMQYLKKHASVRYDLQITDAGRYWHRDGSVEIDILGDLVDGSTLACECKWSSSPIGIGVYYDLMRKISLLPPPRGTGLVRYVIFSAAGFDQNMTETAKNDGVILISGEDLLQ